MYNRYLNPLKRGFFGGRHPRVIAHRGASGTCPENTLVAFERAVADGADILEMDVRLTADGHVVVIHDPTVDRTTDGQGPVASLTLAEIQKLDAGFRFTRDGGKTFPFRGKGVTIPTLESVLVAFPTMPMNVEVKVDDPELARKFIELLTRYGRLQDIMVLVAAEPNKLMHKLRAAAPDAVTGHAYWEVIRYLVCSTLRLPWLFKPKAPAMQVPEKSGPLLIATPSFVRHAHRLGMEVHVWTINDESEMRRLLYMGVDGLFTDYPGRMRRLVDSGKWKLPPGG